MTPLPSQLHPTAAIWVSITNSCVDGKCSILLCSWWTSSVCILNLQCYLNIVTFSSKSQAELLIRIIAIWARSLTIFTPSFLTIRSACGCALFWTLREKPFFVFGNILFWSYHVTAPSLILTKANVKVLAIERSVRGFLHYVASRVWLGKSLAWQEFGSERIWLSKSLSRKEFGSARVWFAYCW